MQEYFDIELSDLRFYSRIGVFPQERTVGNEFVVDMRVRVDSSTFEEENLLTTISYADLYEIISSEMKKESLLLESVAKRIISIVRAQYADILECSISIFKQKPPISGIDGRCGVKLFYKKE